MRKNSWTYPVEFAEDAFGEDKPLLADTIRRATGSETPRLLVVADGNVVQRSENLGRRIGRYLSAHNLAMAGTAVVISGGEKVKADSLQSVMGVARAAMEAHLASGDALLALGGGTILDVAGYAAAQVRGGVKLLRMPTTPAAMFDASLATYAAVDAFGIKDALRVKSEPVAVVIDPAFAKTVLDGVWRGGFSEAVRLALVRDAALMRKLVAAAAAFRERDFGVFAELVRDTVESRRRHGATALGEWSALRLEAMSGYKLPHGYAMAIGVLIDAAYAQLKGRFAESDRELVTKALTDCGAMDGAAHSKHLLSQSDAILAGLDAWRLANGSAAIECPVKIGKGEIDENPDRETMKNALDLIK